MNIIDGRWEVREGDCLDLLRALPDACIDCCVTSPPYWGLRDYGNVAQIGLEETPAEYVARLSEVFAEVRRVLKPDGTLWLNLGDSYAGSGKGGNDGPASILKKPKERQGVLPRLRDGLKPKDLVGIPWRVAFALQDAGWWLRQDIIWAKPNPMPESVTDRCTKSHEYVFLLTKSERYWYDAKAIAEAASTEPGATWADRKAAGATAGNWYASKTCQRAVHGDGSAGSNLTPQDGTRNARSVWTIATQPFNGAHFATMPPALATRCIRAGCRPGGVVLDPFGGAGTTVLAAVREGRQGLAFELNPEYAAIARARIAAAAAQPLLEFDGDEPAPPRPTPKQMGIDLFGDVTR